MTTMNISLPEPLKRFVDSQVESGSYGTISEYVRMLIRREHERETLRQMILDGARSGFSRPADAAYFDELRAQVDSISDAA